MHINQLIPVDSKRKNQDEILQPTTNAPSGSKNYIGMTLKQYINSQDPIPLLQQIEEQSLDSIENLPIHPIPAVQGKITPQTQKEKLKLKHKQELLAIVNNILHLNSPKIPIINLEQLTSFTKNSNKLPIIHKQKSRSSSRNGLSKEQNSSLKKQRCRTLKNEEMVLINYANTTINKDSKNKQINNIYKQTLEMKKISHSRMISTSFFHMQLKEKTRMKIRTEQDHRDKFQNVFMITRYKQSSLAKRKQNIFKKH